ncbi:MAG: AsmA-like C-terminal region-containing protein, partial [Gammaproteobacteria bacterium]
MRVFRLLGYLIGGLFTAAIVIIIIASNIDYGRYKTDLELFASNTLGREFVIDGPLHLTLGRSIRFSAEQVQLASTDWSSEPGMVSVGRLEASLNLWSFINGPILVESLRLDDLRVSLEQNAAGANNWDFDDEEDEALTDNGPAARPSLPVLLDNVSINNLVLVYLSPGLTKPQQFVVDQLLINIFESEQYQLTLGGSVNQVPITLDMTAGDIFELTEFRNLDARLSGHVGEIGFDGRVRSVDLLNPSQPVAALKLTGPSIEYLTDILLLKRITTGPLNLELNMAPDGENVKLDLIGEIGEFNLRADGQFSDLQDLENVGLQLSANGPDTGRIAKIFGVAGVPNEAFNITAGLHRSGKELVIEQARFTLGDTHLDLKARFGDFPSRHDAKLNLRIEGPDIDKFGGLLALPGRLQGSFNMNAEITPLKAGGASVSSSGEVGSINFTVDGDITDDDKLLGSKVQVYYRTPDLRIITTALGIDDAPAVSTEGTALLEPVADGISIKDGSISIDKDQLRFNGIVAMKPPGIGTNLEFESVVQDLRATLSGFGVDPGQIPAEKFTVAGRVIGGDKGIQLKDTRVSLASLKGKLSAKISVPAVVDDSQLSFRIDGDNLAELLPPEDAFRALDKPFSISGTASLQHNIASIPDLQFDIGESRVRAELEIGLDSDLQSARIKIEGSSPDIFVLTPDTAKYVIPAKAPASIESRLEWKNGLLSIEKFHLKLGKGRFEISGSIEGPPNFDRTDLDFDLQFADIHNISPLVGRDLPHEAASMTFHLVGDADAIKVDDFSGKVGANDISGTAVYRSGDKPDLSIKLASSYLNLSTFLPVEDQVEEVQDEPGNQQQHKEEVAPQKDLIDVLENEGTPAPVTNERVIPDTPLPFHLLRAFNARVELSLAEVDLQPHSFRDIQIIGTLTDGGVNINPFVLHGPDGGKLDGKLMLEPLQNGAKLSMRVFGENLKIGLPAETVGDLGKLPRYDLQLAFVTEGSTPREMAAVLNGYMKLTGGEGRIKSGNMQLLTQDFIFEVLSNVNPFMKDDPYLNLKCTAVLASFEDGQVVEKTVLVVQ